MALAAQSTLRFTLPTFEGPLDLLLHLIRENRVDIYDIPIADITQQYLQYLELWEQLDLAIAGEYLVMAATLLEIKSRMLLPQSPSIEVEEDEDPRAELVHRLLEYQKYQGTVETLRGWEEARTMIHFRGALDNPDDYSLPLMEGELTGAHLAAALRKLLERAGIGEDSITAVVPRRKVSLRFKMAEVLRKVRGYGAGLDFELLFEEPLYRYEVVLTFLALLELLRLGKIRAIQKKPQSPIMVYPVDVSES